MKFKAVLSIIIATTGVSLAFQACTGFTTGSSGSNSQSSVGPTGLNEFQSGLYAFANTQGCAACHAAAVAPFFASTDLNTAYTQAETIVNFSNPSASLFIAYSGNNHCSVPACENSASPAEVTALLTSWANIENTAGGGTGPTDTPTYVTATIPIPTPTAIPLVTAKTAPVIINFQLSGLTPSVASLSNAIFQLEVQMDNTTTYKFSNPKIGGNTAAVTISGVHIFIRPSGTTTGIGTEGVAPANEWDSLANIMVAMFSITSTNPTTSIGATALTTTDLFVQQQSTADSITIGFDSIQ
jgi:hypothetical protein